MPGGGGVPHDKIPLLSGVTENKRRHSVCMYVRIDDTYYAMQRQKTVAASLKSKQLLLYAFARQYYPSYMYYPAYRRR